MIVDGHTEMTTLIDSGAQVFSISSQVCSDLALQIQPLGQLLELEGTGGSAIPYLGFVEVNLEIPGIKNYNEDVQLLVIPTMTYSEMVPVMVGSKIIDRAMSLMTKGELTKVTMTWKQAHFGAVMPELLQLPCTGSSKTEVEKEGSHSSLRDGPMEVRKFCLNDARGPVCTTWKVTIPSFSTVSVHTKSSVKGHCIWVYVLMELMPGPQLPTAVVLTATYGELHPGSSRVPICLHNLSSCTVEIPTKALVGQVAPANQVPPVVLPTRTSKESSYKPQKGWVFKGPGPPRYQRMAHKEAEAGQRIAAEIGTLFTCSDLDLGKTALIKHKMEVMDWLPFKEHYQCIPSHMYNDVRAQIQEMLDIGAIQKWHSPWASKVVLVQKKDGSLRICIDLRKLNNQTIEDAYSLPCINETLDSLPGPIHKVFFT